MTRNSLAAPKHQFGTQLRPVRLTVEGADHIGGEARLTLSEADYVARG